MSGQAGAPAAASLDAPLILSQVADGIATITLNRPQSRNALNWAMCDQLIAAVKSADRDKDVRIIVFRANGPVFCAGADIKERDGVSEDWLRDRRLLGFETYDTIETCNKPCVCVAHGPVIGSGWGIAMTCDLIVASEHASFRLPEAVRGSVGATQHLPRIVGKAMAKELLFTGRVVEAQEALRIGMVNHVVPQAELDSETTRIVEAIRGSFPLSVKLMKQCVNHGMEVDVRTGMAYERMAIDVCLAGNEWRKGISDFVSGTAQR